MRPLVAVTLLVVFVGAAGLASAHVNGVAADAQVSANGTVVVEDTLILSDGYAVVHRTDEDGDPGEVIGVREMDAARIYQGLRIPIDDAVWADWQGNHSVWVTLHREEAGAGFDPDQDPIQRNSFREISGTRFTLAKGSAEASVLAAAFETQTTDDQTVRLRRVALPRDGRVVVRPDTTTGLGPVVGSTALPAGVHRNVTVALDRSVFDTENRTTRLFAALHAGESAEPIRAGSDPVGSYFPVRDTRGLENATDDQDSLVVTPTPTPTDVNTPTRAETTTTDTTSTPAADGPGFGLALAVVGVAVAVFARRRLG